MRCTADPCDAPLEPMGGENQEDYGCSAHFNPNPNLNPRHFASTCPASREIHYHTAVKVRQDWYYLAGYCLPFRWIGAPASPQAHHYGWYALVGNPVSNRTVLQGLRLVERSYGDNHWNEATQDYSARTVSECVQETLHEMPYVALPANGDFKPQFHLLRDRMMEGFGARPVNPLYTIRVERSVATETEPTMLELMARGMGIPLSPPLIIGNTGRGLPPTSYELTPIITAQQTNPFANPLQKETRGKLRKLDADEIQQVEALIEKLHLQRVEREEDQRRREAHADKWL